MSLTVDSSVILQIITFFVVWVFLRRLVFDPFSQVVATREARTTGTQAASAALTGEAGNARTRYDAAVAAARTEIAQQSETARKSAQEESDQALTAARNAAATATAQQRDAAARAVDTARQTLLAQAESVANDMLARCTGGRAG